MAEGSISFKLDLVLNLVDTTTGFSIDEKEVIILRDGRVLPMLPREPGTYILMNYGRVDMELSISVKGYEKTNVSVRYEELDGMDYPAIEVPLVPLLPQRGLTDLCTLQGTKRGITDLAAISLNRADAMLGAYNAKKLSLRLFESRRLDEVSYAIFHEEKMEFEEFCIVKKSEKGMLLHIREPLQQECKPEEILVRIVRGITDTKGRYLMRLRMDGSGTKYLVRYTVRGKTKFEIVEFGDERERGLT